MSYMPSVLHIYKDYYPPVIGGVERHINQLAEGTRDSYDVRVLVANTRPRTEIEDINGIPVIKAACLGRFASAPICPTFPRLLKKYAADILHFHCPNPTGDLSYLMVHPPGKIVVTYHSDIVRQKWAMFLYGRFLRRFLRQANVILPTSPRYIESSEYLSPERSKCTVVPLGIQTARFRETPDIHARAQEIKKNVGGRPIILFVGRLRYYKGLLYLIQAMPRIDAHLIIIGSGPEEHNIRKQAGIFKVKERITMAGPVSDDKIISYYHAADVFCLPSHLRSEAYGIVQLEAMACGKPVVATDIDGYASLLTHGEEGLLVPPKDAESLAGALLTLLDDRASRSQMGAKGRIKSEKYSWQNVAHQVMDYYNSLLA